MAGKIAAPATGTPRNPRQGVPKAYLIAIAAAILAGSVLLWYYVRITKPVIDLKEK